MRKVLTDFEEKIERTRVLLGITYPVVVALVLPAALISRHLNHEITWVLFITPVIHSVLTCIWIPIAWRFLHRLKGKEKEEFLRLYRRLYDCSKIDDIVEIAITIDDMATIVNGEYSIVRDFVFAHAGSFLIGVKHLPLRIPDAELLIGILRVLKSNLVDLPEYLSSEDYLVRDAASRRLEELQSTVH